MTSVSCKASFSSALATRMVLSSQLCAHSPAEGDASYGIGEGVIRPLESSDTVPIKRRWEILQAANESRRGEDVLLPPLTKHLL